MLLVWGLQFENYWCQYATQKSRATPPFIHIHLLPTYSWKRSTFTTALWSKRFWNPENPHLNQGSQISICFSFSNFYFMLKYIQLACYGSFRCTTKRLIHTYICIPSPPTPLPSRLPHIEQSTLCYTLGPCWLSILNIAACTGYQFASCATYKYFSILQQYSLEKKRNRKH